MVTPVGLSVGSMLASCELHEMVMLMFMDDERTWIQNECLPWISLQSTNISGVASGQFTFGSIWNQWTIPYGAPFLNPFISQRYPSGQWDYLQVPF